MPPNLFVIMIEFGEEKKKSENFFADDNGSSKDPKEFEFDEDKSEIGGSITVEKYQEFLRATLDGVKREKLILYDSVWTYGEANTQHLTITFPCPVEHTDIVMDRLINIGIGTKVGALSILPSAYTSVRKPEAAEEELATKSTRSDNASSKMKAGMSDEEESEAPLPRKPSTLNQQNGLKTVETAFSRIRVEQVIEQIKRSAVLDFDYVMLVLVAATLAGVGLATDNTVVIVASMLVSPIMGPILAFTFGTTLQNKKLILIGLRNELFSLFLCVLIGFLVGLISAGYGVRNFWPTEEMGSRGTYDALILGVAIAVPSGMGVALSILGNNTSSLVGVAISASLLPPAVNCGMLLAYAATVNALHPNNQLSKEEITENVRMGLVSLALTIVNIACIFVTSIFMFKVKEFRPGQNKSPFWERDIKLYRTRAQNRTGQAPSAFKRIGKTTYQENATVAQQWTQFLEGHYNKLTPEERKAISVEESWRLRETLKATSDPLGRLSSPHGQLEDLFPELKMRKLDYLDGIEELFEEEEEDSEVISPKQASVWKQIFQNPLRKENSLKKSYPSGHEVEEHAGDSDLK